MTFRQAQAEARQRAESAPSTERPVDPKRFFDKNGGLLHRDLKHAVLEPGPIRTGVGGTLWRYRDGVWLPDGKDEVTRRVVSLMDQRFRASYPRQILEDLMAQEPFIDGEQPEHVLNFANGLLEWSTGELLDHTADLPTTYQITAAWNEGAECPTVDEWVAQVAPPDAIDLLWEVFGVAMYGGQPFHRAVLLYGPGRNGKGTFLRLIKAMIGAKHISSVTLQDLADNRFAAADLFGKVANIAGDLDSRHVASTGLFKMITGGDPIRAERKYGDSFQFTSAATMIFAANELPRSSDHTHGFMSRWVVIPFDRLVLADGEEDPTLEARLHAELEGVAVRAVEGLCRAMTRGGFGIPESVAAATGEYRDNADPLRLFYLECLRVTKDPTHLVARARIYDRYKEWAEENNYRPMSPNRFWPGLVAVDPDIDINRRSNNVRMVGGVSLVTDF